MHVKNKTGRGQFSLEIDILYFYILLYGKNPFISKNGIDSPFCYMYALFFLIFNFSIKKYIMNNNKSFMH